MKVVVDGGTRCSCVVAVLQIKQPGLRSDRFVHRYGRRFPESSSRRNGRSQHTRQIQEAVVRTGSEIGIAYDGDTDRVGIADEKGKIVRRDELMVVFSRSIMKDKAALQ